MENGLLIEGDRICIPPELYERMLHDLHEGHKGIEKMQHLAHDKIYWQRMDADITEYVKNCKICTKHKSMQAIQPMIPRDIPEGPWQDLAADFFHHNNSDYLLIADTFCKYPFLYKVTSKAAEPVTCKLKSLISQYGSPRSLSTDNDPPFSSETFANFMLQHCIEHIMSSPLYPKSNGFIERQIKTIKTALSTGHDSKLPIEDILLNIRTQPIGPNLPSPREILHNCIEACPGKPSTPVDMEAVRDYLITKKNLQKEYHDKTRNAKSLPDLSQGQEVLFLSPADPNQYIEGTVLAKAPQPRSYLLESQGKTYHHTRQHICSLSNAIIPRPSEPEQQITTISGPSTSKHQNVTISGPPPSEQQKTTITGPPMPEHQNTTITRPSASPRYIPTISRPPTPKPIPAPCRKFLPRPPQPPTTTPNFS